MPWKRIVESVGEANRLARSMDYDYLDLLKQRLQVFTPAASFCKNFTPQTVRARKYAVQMSGFQYNFSIQSPLTLLSPKEDHAAFWRKLE